MVGVRIYRRATDMDHVIQAQIRRGINREIDLDRIEEQLSEGKRSTYERNATRSECEQLSISMLESSSASGMGIS